MAAIPSAAGKGGHNKKTGSFHNPFGIKMQSKTVVMNNDYVSTGVLTYVEGDIIEIELDDLKSFALGDQVKITIYSTGGIHVFESHVVAKNKDSIIILNSPENKDKFAERREHPRVQIEEKGILHAIVEAKTKLRRELEDPLDVTLKNISISGIGFQLYGQFALANSTELELEAVLGERLQVKAEVVRREKTEFGYFYGAQFTGMEQNQLNLLRAYVLTQQVEWYYRRKEENRLKEQEKR
jgi:c-di-GMP-binding flagellar brake protein YcgR